MTKEDCTIVSAYTGINMLIGSDLDYFYKYVDKLIGREVWTHELPGLADEIKEKSKADFLKLCEEAI